MHQRPRNHAEGQENHPGGRRLATEELGVLLGEEREQRERDQSQEQEGEFHFFRVEERDDRDGNEVVHHGERQQEDPQGTWQV